MAGCKEFDTSLKDTKCEVKWSGTFNKFQGFRWGGQWNGTHTEGFSFKDMKSVGVASHESGDNTAGFHVNFDWNTRKLSSVLALQNK